MDEIWEFEPHTVDDDGFQVKCYGGQTETDVPVGDLVSWGRGFAACPECSQSVPVVSING